MASVQQKPVIFLAFANDQSDATRYLRNLPDEIRSLRKLFKPMEDEGLCEVVLLSNVTPHDLVDVFQESRYRNRIAIFHYAGHAGGYELLLESASGTPEVAHAEGLAGFLGQQSGLQLVFLNGCSTQAHVEGLLEANVPGVIATSEAISDEVATEFASRFYYGIVEGSSIQTAYQQAVNAIKTTRGGLDRSTLYVRGEREAPVGGTDRWPWDLYIGEGADIVKSWNIPEASGDSLFGLPELEKKRPSPDPIQTPALVW